MCEEDISNVILGRQVLDEIGLDNRTLLAAASDRLKGVVDVALTNKDGTHCSGMPRQPRQVGCVVARGSHSGMAVQGCTVDLPTVTR